MIEKVALFRIAFCKAPVFSKASLRRTSVIGSVAGPLSPGTASDGMLIVLFLLLPSLRPGRPHHGCRARGCSRSVPLPGQSSPHSFAKTEATYERMSAGSAAPEAGQIASTLAHDIRDADALDAAKEARGTAQ